MEFPDKTCPKTPRWDNATASNTGTTSKAEIARAGNPKNNPNDDESINKRKNIYLSDNMPRGSTDP